MSFVNEWVSPEDMEKYSLAEINKAHHLGAYKLGWTVDKERGMYLRYLKHGREEQCNEWYFSFFWKGAIMTIMFRCEGGGDWYGEQWRRYKLLRMIIPEAVKKEKRQLIADLKEALTAFKDFGVMSTSTKHTATFEF